MFHLSPLGIGKGMFMYVVFCKLAHYQSGLLRWCLRNFKIGRVSVTLHPARLIESQRNDHCRQITPS
jgi:hypothetical protein